MTNAFLSGVEPRRALLMTTVRSPLSSHAADEAFRVLEALEDVRLELRQSGAALGLQDELATVIRMLHGKLGLDEGGVL
jgi:hypothetical protein